jgi:O-antigen ligase
VDWGYRQIVSDVSAGEAIRLPLAIAQLGAIVFVISVLFFRWRGAAGLVALGLMAISAVLVIKTGSRGQLISMILAAMLFFPISRGWSLSRGTLVGLGAAALAIAAIWTFLPDLSNLLSTQEGRFDAERAMEDYETRVAAADRLLDVYLSSGVLVLLFGLGNSASFAPQVVGFYTHIVPVEILCELGAVGFLLFVGALGFTVRALIRLASIMSSPQISSETRRAVACLSALALIELLLSFKQGSLVRDVNLFLFPILIEGLLASLAARSLKETAVRSMGRSATKGTPQDLAVGS